MGFDDTWIGCFCVQKFSAAEHIQAICMTTIELYFSVLIWRVDEIRTPLLKGAVDMMCGIAFSINIYTLLTQSKRCDQMWSFPFIWCFTSIFSLSTHFTPLPFPSPFSWTFFNPVVFFLSVYSSSHTLFYSMMMMSWSLAHCIPLSLPFMFLNKCFWTFASLKIPCTQTQSLSGFNFVALRCIWATKK